MEISDRQKELIESEAVAVATINADGSPNLIAVGFVKVIDPTSILITDNYMNHTPENIKNDSRICLAVWTKDWNEGYKFNCKATYFTEGKWVDYVKNLQENKGYPAKGAILCGVDGIFKLG